MLIWVPLRRLSYMKRIATSKDMLFEQRLAAEYNLKDYLNGKPRRPAADGFSDSIVNDGVIPPHGWNQTTDAETLLNRENALKGAIDYLENWGPRDFPGRVEVLNTLYDAVDKIGAQHGHEAKTANERDRLAEVWKRVENAIYQGPDSALPEVIEILESIIPVIELAASEGREPQVSPHFQSLENPSTEDRRAELLRIMKGVGGE